MLYVEGNLFTSPAQVLVNTVNTVGVMGKGIAKEFKRIYPAMFREYQTLCERGELKIGQLHLYKTPHKWILNFPTKTDWRQKSKPDYIEAGLKRFVATYAKAGIQSVAFPPLGCGHGQLNFKQDVKPLMEKYLRPLPIEVFIYPAKVLIGAPEHKDPKGIAEWLRSEPAALPFSEVWQDLLAKLGETASFKTASKKSEYSVEAIEDPPALVIRTNGDKKTRTFKLNHGELLAFWQQLRQHGFAYNAIAAKHHRLWFLLPIFELLPYVHRVAVSTSEEGLDRGLATALQVMPPVRNGEPDQGTLFAPSEDGEKAGR